MMAKLPLIPEFQHGWKLPGLDFRLDPPRACPVAFVSHAHSDHVARHARVVCSIPTADLLAARYRLAEARLDPRPFGVGWEENGHRFELRPAGHVLGSAMLHVTRMEDGASLLFTGDFKLRPSLTAEPPSPKQAGLLMMETTFGRPRYVFPPRAEVWAQVHQFVREALEDGALPVLAGYSLGKAQEIIANLAALGVPILAHPSILELDEPFRKHCPVTLPPLVPFSDGVETGGHVLVVPPNAARSPAVRKIQHRRVMVFTGWGLDSAAAYRYRADAVAPISDHADFPELLRLVEIVQPARVLAVHGFEEEFAATLRARGIEAWSGRGTDQLELFQDERALPPTREAGMEELFADENPADAPQVRKLASGSLAGWAATGDAMARTVSNKFKTTPSAGLSPFVAVPSMLASPEPDVAAVFARMGARSVWLEDKFDGIRAQLHKAGGRAKIFSRDLRDISMEFPQICQAALGLTDDVVLDGEIIAEADGKRLRFQDLRKGLGRKLAQNDLFLGASVPVRFLAFDCLWHQGQSLIDLPLSRRREHLDSLSLPESLVAVPVCHAASPEEIDRAFADACSRGNGGLIAKDPAAPYSPGRRGKAWIKLKMAESFKIQTG